MRRRRYRPRSESSARRSAISLMGLPPDSGGPGGVGSAVGSWWHGGILGEAQLGGGVPEPDLQLGRGLGLQQVLDDVRGLAVEPAVAVVGPRVGAVVGLAGDVEPEVLEHGAV